MEEHRNRQVVVVVVVVVVVIVVVVIVVVVIVVVVVVEEEMRIHIADVAHILYSCEIVSSDITLGNLTELHHG